VAGAGATSRVHPQRSAQERHTHVKTIIHQAFLDALVRRGLPEPEAEYRFHPRRKCRLEWAWPTPKIALEVVPGRACFLRDVEKCNLALICGWRVLRCTPGDMISDLILEQLALLLGHPTEPEVLDG